MCMYVMLRILKEKKGTSDKIILGSWIKSKVFFRLGAKYKSEIRAKAQMNITHKNLFILGANPCIQHKVYLFVQ